MISGTVRLLTQQLVRRRVLNTKPFQAKRNSSDVWVYRQEPPPAAKWTYYAADGLNAFFWWWVFVHLWYDWGHIVGEFDYPDAKKWTDEELGVVSED
ncbi:NADH dehydrogenase [ubiquinone] 1 beta subcomplex subunit 2, mitochondrial, partial [Stegodyphus mimosarum]